jgi:hypothetical protein
LTLVLYLGGCTASEISALRFLSARDEREHARDYIVCTTKLINGATFIDSLQERIASALSGSGGGVSAQQQAAAAAAAAGGGVMPNLLQLYGASATSGPAPPRLGVSPDVLAGPSIGVAGGAVGSRGGAGAAPPPGRR